MTYAKIWQKALVDQEQVMHEFSVGPGFRNLGMSVALVATIIITLILMGFLAAMNLPIWPAALVGLATLAMATSYFLFYLPVANAFAFTNERVLVHRGWLSTSAISVDYSKITDISVRDPVLERWLTDTGYIVINTAGGDKDEVVLSHVAKPFEIKKILDQLKDAHVHQTSE